MRNQHFSDGFYSYMQILRRWVWLLVLSTCIVGSVVYAVSSRKQPVYQASTLMLVNEAPSNKGIDITVIQTSERLAKTYARVMMTRPILEGAIERVGLDRNPEELEKRVKVSPVIDTQLIELTVKDQDPRGAANLANAIVAEFIEQNLSDQEQRFAASKQNMESELARLSQRIQEESESLNRLKGDLENQAEYDRIEASLTQFRQSYTSLLQSYEQVRLAEAQSTSTILQKDPATPALKPIQPKIFRDTVIGLVIGLSLGLGIVFLFETLDDTVRDSEDVGKELGLPVLAIIGSFPSDKPQPITITAPRDPAVEAFRSLRTYLQFAGAGRPLRTFLLTSPSPEEGKSTVAVNLAVVLSQNGHKALLLDADMRRPVIHQLLGIQNNDGLSEMLSRPSMERNGNPHTAYCRNLDVLTAGTLPQNPAELLGSQQMIELLRAVEKEYDVGVIDAPPLLAVTDATALAPQVDGVLLVIKPGKTKLSAAKLAVEQLERVGANILGVVLNGVDRQHYRYYPYDVS